MKKTTLKLKLPFVMRFGDYHEINEVGDRLNEIFSNKIRSYECAFDGNYWAVFYVGCRPKVKDINVMLEEAGLDVEAAKELRSM